MNSANHYSTAGRAQTGIKPSTSTYLGSVAEGELERKVSEATPPDAAAAALVRPECTVSLTCNRETSTSSRAEMDVQGMMAVVCTHIIPCLGLALAMTAHEHHGYYERLLEYLMPRRPDLRFFYLDLMCRFAHKVPTIIKSLKRRGLIHPDAVCAPELLVPWMHSFDHNMECQLEYSPLYRLGAGCRVGEQTEQLWAKIKSFSKIARYMAFHHYWDNMNLLLEAITLRTQATLPSTLRRQVNKNEAKIGELGGDIWEQQIALDGQHQLAAAAGDCAAPPPTPAHHADLCLPLSSR
jgi:hypothetical protein